MKKLLSFLAAGALALGLIGCSGDMHDELDPSSIKYGLLFGNNTILDTADICGTVDGWTGSALTKVDDTTYTYTFTASDTTEQFSIREVAGSWTAGNRWCGALKKDEDNALKVKNGGSATLIYSDDPDPSHCKLVDLSIGTSYTLTFTIEDEDAKTISVALASAGGGSSAPIPYYFDGLYLVGACFNTSANSTAADTWAFYASNLIHGAQKDVATGNLTYTVDIKATKASGEMGINDSSWGNKLNGVGVTIAANAATATELNGTEGNFNVTGLTVGSAYRVEITTTPQKVVTVKIYEIAEITLSVKITNLTEGDSAWINGNIWGSAWPMGWPILAWNGNDAAKTAGYISAHAAAVADAAGDAVFGAVWNATIIAKPGDTLNWEFKVVYINDGDAWDDDGAVKDCGANITFDYDVTTGGAKTLVIDASDWSVTVE
jgi:hypothetical protein